VHGKPARSGNTSVQNYMLKKKETYQSAKRNTILISLSEFSGHVPGIAFEKPGQVTGCRKIK